MPADKDKCQMNPLCDLAKTRFEEMDRRIDERFLSLKDAINKSENILNVRLEQMNEFRKQISDERLAYVTRRETILLNFIISIIVVCVGAFITILITK